MASIALGSFIAINGIDLSGVLKTVQTKANADMKDKTTLNQTQNREWTKGLVERTISGEGFFRKSATVADDANGLLQSALTSTTGDFLGLFGRDGSSIGALAEMYNFLHSSYEVDETVGELIMASFEAKATKTGTADFYGSGVFLMNQNVTGAVNGTTYDNAASSTGYLAQVHNLSGDGNATVKIQHSTNGTVWVDLIDFSTVTLNTAEQASSTGAGVNRYSRAIVTAVGATNATIVVAMKAGYTG